MATSSYGKVKITDHAAIGIGVLTVAVLGVGAWLIYEAWGKIGGWLSGNNSLTQGTPYQDTGVLGTLGAATNTVLGGAPQAIGEAAGGAVFDIFHPNATGEMTYYTVAFPDGNSHAIASGSVSSDGTFSYGGTLYQIQDDSAGKHHAVPEGS